MSRRIPRDDVEKARAEERLAVLRTARDFKWGWRINDDENPEFILDWAKKRIIQVFAERL